MKIDIDRKYTDLLKKITLHGNKLTGLKGNFGSENMDEEEYTFTETLMEVGLIYPCIENGETGKRVFHITLLGKEALSNLQPRLKRLEEIELSVRAYNAFKAAHMDTIGDILDLGMDKLCHIVGRKAFVEMEAVLFELGL